LTCGVKLVCVPSIVLSILSPSWAAAQTSASTRPAGGTTPPARSVSTPKVDLFAGIGVWRGKGFTWPGFQLTAVRPWRHVGLVGDLAFFERRTRFMGGVRAYAPMQTVTVVAQMLLGRCA